jgi:hypothetical protein
MSISGKKEKQEARMMGFTLTRKWFSSGILSVGWVADTAVEETAKVGHCSFPFCWGSRWIH